MTLTRPFDVFLDAVPSLQSLPGFEHAETTRKSGEEKNEQQKSSKVPVRSRGSFNDILYEHHVFCESR